MSVTFGLVKKVPGMVGLQFMFPDDFDRTPVVDPEYPEYGALPPDNPWELNVSNSNAREILRTLGYPGDSQDLFESGGVIEDINNILEVCEQTLATIRTIPDLDAGSNSTKTKGPTGPTFIECGHIPGWYTHRFTQLLKMATIAKQKGAVIYYA